MSLGDRKPSQLLAEMRTKASDTPVTEELLLSLWQRNLPEQVRAILSSDTTLTAIQAASIADRIVESTRNTPPMHLNAMQTTQAMHSMTPNQPMPQMHQISPVQTLIPMHQMQHMPTMQPIQQLHPIPIAPIANSSTSAINRIQTQINQILNHLQNNHQQRSNTRNGSSQRSQTPARATQSDATNTGEPRKFETCWWHFKFGAEARKCKAPCNFQNSGN